MQQCVLPAQSYISPYPRLFHEQDAGMTVEAAQVAVTEMSAKCGFSLTESKLVLSLHTYEDKVSRLAYDASKFH